MTVTERPLREAAAFLDHFLQSDWASCHVRGGAIEMFVSREARHTNPMLEIASEEAAVIDAEDKLLTAPHLGTLVELAAVGSRVVTGERYGTIELLGEPIDLVADRAGTVRRHIGQAGVLVQYEDALVALN